MGLSPGFRAPGTCELLGFFYLLFFLFFFLGGGWFGGFLLWDIGIPSLGLGFRLLVIGIPSLGFRVVDRV